MKRRSESFSTRRAWGPGRVGGPQELQHRDVRDVVHVASREEAGVDALRVHGEHLGAHDVRDVALDALVLEVLGRREADAELRALHDLGQAAAVGAERGVGVVDLGDRGAAEEEDRGPLPALAHRPALGEKMKPAKPWARQSVITGWEYIASLKSPKSWPFWKR
jgi:hypothetical protein